MLMNLYNKLGTTLYIQVWEKRIKATDIKTNKTFDEEPFVVIETTKEKQKVVSAIGVDALSEALKSNTELINPFHHPRTLLSDFQVGESLVKHIVKVVIGKKWYTPLPIIIIHPMEKIEGGLTTIEKRAFLELAHSAGAREAFVHEGKELSINCLNNKSIRQLLDQ